MKALVTGFDPFDGAATNASGDAVLALPSRVGAWRVVTAILPTSFARAFDSVATEIERESPDLVLCVGEAGERNVISLERVAINLQDARVPDNDGAQPIDCPSLVGAPLAHFATVPLRPALHALHTAGLPAEISHSAGTFVCNHVFYRLMQLLSGDERAPCAGFLHVPRSGVLSPEQSVRAICVILEACETGMAERAEPQN